ncbi:MAG: hypothetical protein IE923_18930 [Micrococcales bacterium]|nr:hypothetical protein [Micrococcales bacterium]
MLAGVGASAVLAGAVLAPVAVTNAQVERQATSLAGAVDAALAGEAPCFGAAAVFGDEAGSCADSHVVRDDYSPTAAAEDTQNNFLLARGEEDPTFRRECARVPDSVIERCDVGQDTGGGVMVVVGDSHADHLMTPLAAIAARHDMAVVEVRRWSCRPVLPLFASPLEAEADGTCVAWKSQMVDYVASLDARVVVTSGAAQGYGDLPPELDAEIVSAYQQTWQPWLETGAPLLVISDVPRWDVAVPLCVELGSGSDPCTRPRGEVVVEDLAMTAAASVDAPGLGVVDLYPAFCDDDTCHAVVGGVITHRDSNHLTSTFAASLAPRIEQGLLDLGAF